MPNSRTPVISFASTKGGVGKTTLAFALATGMVDRMTGNSEYRIACIDADPNRTLDSSLRKAETTEIISMVSDAETMLQTLRDAEQAAGLVLIDLEGSANQSMLYAMGKSDLVIVPAQPSAFDVREARKTAGVVQQAADLVGRPIEMRVILTRTPPLKQRVTEHSRAQFAQSGLPMLPVELVHRVAFQNMSYSGTPPFKADPGGNAAENVDRLADAVAEIVGLTLRVRSETRR